METNFPFIDVPKHVLPLVGKPVPGTRIYRQKGSADQRAYWFEALQAFVQGMVSPGGVCMLAPVSRAAVHKRLKEGRLTAFCFHVTKQERGFFRRVVEIRETPSVYIPSSEAKAWAEELKERALRLGHITRKELEGAKPDWHGKFWEWNEKRDGK